MATISEIKEAIAHLPEKEFKLLADWVQKLDEKRWDKELEKDIAEGRLDGLAQEALDELYER